MRTLQHLRHLLGLCALAGILHAAAAPVSGAPDRTLGERALAAYDADLAKEAADLWIEMGEQIISDSPSPDERRHAALLFVCATMGYEAAGDAKAYPSWGLAIRHFLEAGTRWSDERERLTETLRELRMQLQAADASVGGVVLPTPEEAYILELGDRLDFQTFEGPAGGLSLAETADDSTITVNRQFYSQTRPQETSNTDRSDGRQVRIGRADDLLDDFSQANSQRRGFGDVPPEPPIESPPVPKRGEVQRATEEASVPLTSVSSFDANGSEDLPDTPPAAGLILRNTVVPASPPQTSPSEPEIEAAEEVESETDDPSISLFRQDTPQWTSAHRAIAETAWNYFEVNRQSTTGLFNSVHNYPYTTLWDVGSGLAAMVSAHQIGILAGDRFNRWMGQALDTIADLPTYRGELPNREYSTKTGRMIDLRSRASNEGSGWSALDIGRMMTWLRITYDLYPEHRDTIDRAISGWDFTRLSAKGDMQGTFYDGEQEKLRQEGRLGYEQYAAAGYREWGVVLPNALDYDTLQPVTLLGVELAHDPRNRAYLTSEPFIMAAMEYGEIDPYYTELTEAMFDLQRTRYEALGILTAVSEDSIDRKPWFLYNSVFFDGKPWQCVRPSGTEFPELRTISTKAAIAWDAVFGGPYGAKLSEATTPTRHGSFGYYAGLWESGGINKSLNINTNAVILESMLYRFRGGKPFIASRPPRSGEASGP